MYRAGNFVEQENEERNGERGDETQMSQGMSQKEGAETKDSAAKKRGDLAVGNSQAEQAGEKGG